MSPPPAARTIRVGFHPDWNPEDAGPERRGLFASDRRVRTLLRVLVSYPDVRYVLPDRLSLEVGADPRLLDTLARFLERQRWLVQRVTVL